MAKVVAVLAVSAVSAVGLLMMFSSNEQPHDRAGPTGGSAARQVPARVESAPTTPARVPAAAETAPVVASTPAPAPARAARSYPADSALLPAVRTFLSKDPDAIGLLDEIRLLGSRAVVVPESVQHDPDGTTKGDIVLSDGSKASFSVVGRRYSIELNALGGLESEFSTGKISLSCVDRDGSTIEGKASIDFHPKPGGDFMKYCDEPGGDLPLTWEVGVGQDVVTSRPTSAISRGQREGTFEVRATRIPVQKADSPGALANFDPWLSLLRPVAQ